MDSEKKKLTVEERIELHHRMAEGYGVAYLHRAVKDGASYEAWKFSDDAVYSSPYFISDVMPLRESSISVSTSATMEAKAYSLKFPDWSPAEFKYWPADNGFVMKTRWEGHTQEGVKMGFYSYSFIETNEYGEISRWETHVNEEYNAFLDVAIGVHGPFKGREAYNEALTRTLKAAGVSL
jgi:hypothetical protein